MTTDVERLAAAAAALERRGIRRVEAYAWRDLDDPEAGGSELHAEEIFRRWASVGIEVHLRTSTLDDARSFDRSGYRVTQRGGRFDVFARVAARQSLRRRPADTATIEIWNGVPWFGPIWAPRRRVVWLHHVHREMWADVLPRLLAAAGRWTETRFAPLIYRRSRFATLSESSAAEIREMGIPDANLGIIPPGVDDRFTPDESMRNETPLVVVVGRLAPVKRHRWALAAVEQARREQPNLTVEVLGEGPERPGIEAWIRDHDADGWVTLRGRVTDDELLDAYRRAWVVLSASHAEGWGMSLSEGNACGTPSVASDIAGHRCAVVDGRSGVLAGESELGTALADLLGDDERRAMMSAAGVDLARQLSWTSVAAQHLELLVEACD
ncbi:MAG: glycosyltransferase family 4 protein [Ilumatobacteraceae bacterium]